MASRQKPRNLVLGQGCIGVAVVTAFMVGPFWGGHVYAHLERDSGIKEYARSRDSANACVQIVSTWRMPQVGARWSGAPGAGARGRSRALRTPRRFEGNHLEWILLDLRCPLSLGWGSRQWSAFGWEMRMCVGLASHTLVIRTSASEHQESQRQTYHRA